MSVKQKLSPLLTSVGAGAAMVLLVSLAGCDGPLPDLQFAEAELEACGVPDGGWQSLTHYRLTAHIDAEIPDGEACFEPTPVPYVTLDGNGYIIRNASPPLPQAALTGIGIRLVEPNRVTVMGFTLNDFATGLLIESTYPDRSPANYAVRVEDMRFSGNAQAVRVTESDDVTILQTFFRMAGARVGSGVIVTGSERLLLARSIFSGLRTAVEVSGSSSTIRGNIIEQSRHGIHLDGGSHDVLNNQLDGTSGGIAVNTVEQTLIADNTVVQDVAFARNRGSLHAGAIEVANSSDVTIRGNVVRNNNENDAFRLAGILLDRTVGSTVEDNTVEGNVGTSGLAIQSSSQNTIRRNRLVGNRFGVISGRNPRTGEPSEQNSLFGNYACENTGFDLGCFGLLDARGNGNTFGTLDRCLLPAPAGDPNWPQLGPHYELCPE